MLPVPYVETRTLQNDLEQLRIAEGFDFAAIATPELFRPSAPIKWQFVSGNTNERYKLIILKKGRGLAGNVMKTGKRMIIEDVSQEVPDKDRVRFPILLSENLTSVIVIPLWFEGELWGVLLLGQRNGKALPAHYQTIDITGRLSVFSEEM
ncbi:nitrate respiration regulation accessory nitrate sensor NreA [Staphylococcus auricularis]|uniref:GAF domain-containing protein n=1 Tax=Staphylococcus auricularis TaxID=29379 RepID=A0AAP8PQ33_9STAP|nr:nitrate respiration regulation accessory nitrate sensor NreA [Staphylococcus auricularis]MCG7340729.1 nitrate respiration regulation accessory nitrate sensor NreA [Staphylococcus auricularis]MDC6327234.1 nitrate respiration regulation accessory nitrate sensor NreA [Staphylococcus auricularis]MDN4533056.1 nitrate respiration regulation accessory nitrate sensor NreA [Staphylococcus auricularis]MDN4533442.1 nitrate respiration regulation accessory nitrate sensor NreA [Staphylococcus auricularis